MLQSASLSLPSPSGIPQLAANTLSMGYVNLYPMFYDDPAQEVWRDFLRDFVVEVVRRPVVAVGNSIGGYISASLAADYPALVSGEPC